MWFEVVIELGLKAGDSDLEELVEIGGADREEPHAFEERYGWIDRFLENAFVEIEPRQFSIDVQAWVVELDA